MPNNPKIFLHFPQQEWNFDNQQNVTSCQTSPVPWRSFSYETQSTMAREVSSFLFYTDLWTGSKTTWWLMAAFFVRTISTVIKVITVECAVDAVLVSTSELAVSTVTRLLAWKQITTWLAKILHKLAHQPHRNDRYITRSQENFFMLLFIIIKCISK